MNWEAKGFNSQPFVSTDRSLCLFNSWQNISLLQVSVNGEFMCEFGFHFLAENNIEDFKFLVVQGDVTIHHIEVKTPDQPEDAPPFLPPVSTKSGVYSKFNNV